MNPYAPPSSTLEPSPQGHAWRDQNLVVLGRQGLLPRRCVKCNGPALEPIKSRKVYWHHPAVYFTILLNILIYLVVALAVRKTATINPGLCQEHTTRRHRAIALGWIGALIGIVIGFVATANEGCALAVVGVLLFLASLFVGLLGARILYPVKIDETQIRLKGAGEAYLASLGGSVG